MKQSELIISTGVRPPLHGAEPSAQEDTAADTGEPNSDGEVEHREVTVGAQHHNQRLDRALADLLPEFSRSYLQQILALGDVQCNTRVQTKASGRVRATDRLVVTLRPTPQSQAFRPEPMALRVVFEDAHLLVVNKPPGLVVHPAPGNWSGTLLNGLLAHHAGAAMLPRAGIVHRLDKDTSGLMVVAKTRAVMDALVQMIAARTVSRQYLALAHRRWTGPRTRQVDAALGRDPRNRLRMAALDQDRFPTKTALTDIELLDNAEAGCWVRCALHTGRTHQIRVHMAFLGHPLVSDVLYGGSPAVGMERQALHACRLAFAHPINQSQQVFYAPLPPDMLAALDAWGLRYNTSAAE